MVAALLKISSLQDTQSPHCQDQWPATLCTWYIHDCSCRVLLCCQAGLSLGTSLDVLPALPLVSTGRYKPAVSDELRDQGVLHHGWGGDRGVCGWGAGVQYTGHSSPVTSLCWLPTSQSGATAATALLASCEASGSLHIWSATTGAGKLVFKEPSATATGGRRQAGTAESAQTCAPTGRGVAAWRAESWSSCTTPPALLLLHYSCCCLHYC